MLAEISWPILERIPLGPIPISPHGIGIAVGFMLGAGVFMRRVERRGLSHEYVPDIRMAVNELVIRAAIGALIGARVFYVINNFSEYRDDPVSILRVWEGGITFLGGVAGAIILAYPHMRRRGYRTIQVLDSAVPGIALGLVLGRLGDLAIGDHIGDAAPASWPLAWRCSGNFWDEATNTLHLSDPLAPVAWPGPAETQGCFDVAVHQTALYDGISAVTLVLLLLWLERKPRWDGFFVAATVYWYGTFRFAFDFVREDTRHFGLTGSQLAMLGAMVAVTAFLAITRPWRRVPWSWSPPDFDVPWLQPPASEEAAAPG